MSSLLKHIWVVVWTVCAFTAFAYPGGIQVTLVRVRGTVTTESGRSPEGFDVRLFYRSGSFGAGRTVAVVDASGSFDLPQVARGVYELIIEPHTLEPGDDGREFVDQMIEVTDRDLTLSLTAGPGASITGRVVSEPAGAVTRPIGLRVIADHDRDDRLVAPGRSIASAVYGDWSFTMTGLSGVYDFRASSDRLPAVIATRVVVDGTSYPVGKGKGIALAAGNHDLVVVVAPRDPPTPTVDTSLTAAELVERFTDEKMFWKQFEIGKAIVEKHDASVLLSLADWLEHADRHIRGNVAFIYASFGDPRGLQTIAGILTDRSDRSEGQGIATASSDLRYHVERQIAADRYYAAHLLGDLKDPRGVELLVPLLTDPETRWTVPWSLEQIGDARAIRPLIAALDVDDPAMRVQVIYVLETLHATEAIPRLLMLIHDDRTPKSGAAVSPSEAAKAAIAALR